MPSITIPTPHLEALQRFCLEHTVHPTALFKLSWALIVHCYFDTSAFLYEERNEDLKGNGDVRILVSFLPELARESSTIRTLQRNGMQRPEHDTVLAHSSAKQFDSSLYKISSRLQILERSGGPQESGENTIQADGEFDVEVLVQLHDSKLNAVIRYDAKLTETLDLGDIARAFGHTLESMLLMEGGGTVADIDLLSKRDAERIFEWNAQAPFAIEDCLHHLIERSISKNPDSMALQSWDGFLTYSELDQLSSRLAHHLRRTFEIEPERIVPLCFEKSIWAVVAMLAVLKAGAAYCCLDPAHPQARRNYMIELVEATFVLCSPVHVNLIQNCPALIVDGSLVTSLKTPATMPQSNVEPGSACVIAFTSGTTGNPKAIIHSHISVCSGLLANAPIQNINRSSIRLFQWAAYTFDVSITETFSPLIYGGLVCIPSEEERLNNVEECMIRMNVDWAYFTPTFARFFRRYTIPSLKQLILGGEAVTVDDVRDWVGKVRVLNAYGPAESITWFLEPQEGRSSTISIGKPINMRAWIVSPEDPARLMPIGSIGELLLEGTSLFRGYIKNKEKTEQSLIASPIWHIQANLGGGLKMYKTGDLVRYLPDGTMTYIGRKDTMIKLYGQRMELEEVETMLRRNLPESVQSSADVVRPTGENEEPVLVAFLCVPEEFLGSSLQELKTHLQSKLTEALPAFMVPKIYIPVESMPYNSSRKLDRARLRQMVSSLTRNQLIELLQSKESSPQGKSQYLSPIEMALQKLWVDALLLDPKQVGPDNNFFALGGSSVTALKVTAAAKKEGIKLSYPDLFRAPTLRSLARVVSRSSNGTDITMPPFGLIEDTVKGTVISDAINQCQVPEDMIEDIYPLAPQQQGLWALSLIRGGDYIAQFILTLNPEVDVEKFCIAWETVVQLSPTLRTRFIESASGSYQVVLKGDINWQICSDLDDHLNGDIKTELAFGSPIVRHALISERERDVNTHKIIWTIHHALFDGESVPMFLNAVARAYDGVPPSPHIGPFNPFIKYVHSLDDRAASEYWRSQFDEIAPAAYPNLPELTYRPNPSCVYRKHIQFTRRLGSRITTATLLRAALALTMVKLTKNWDVTIGVTLAGRTAPVSNIESVIGPTFVTLPTRPFHGPNDNVQDYLDHTQSSITEMMPFEHTGMQKIATFSPQCDAASKFQTICLVQTPDDTSYTKLFNFDDTTGGVGRFNSHSLMVLLFTNPSGVDAVLSYDRAVIDDEEVFKLAYLFEGLIHVLCLEEDMRSITSILSFEPILEEFVNDPKLDAEQSLQGEIDQWPDTPPEMITDGLTASQPREMEILLAEAWVETLRLPENSSIGPKDEFVKTFGGTSLLSLKLAQCCREKGVHLTVKDIFLYPRLADMARAATEVFSEKNKTALVPPFSLIRPSENTILLRTEAATTCGILVNKVIDLYPCTPLQEGLLALSVTQPGSYISRTIYELVDHIDANRFCDSWNKLYQEEEILRTRLFQPKSASSAFQIVLSDTIEWQFPTNLALYMKEDEEVKMGFGTPLNRFALVRDTESSKRYFVLTIHHALYDGWSMPLLLDRVYETYSATGLTQARPSFNMFIQKITSSNPSDTSEYWKSQFQDADLVHFPPPLLLTEKPGKQVNLESSMSLSRTRHSGILTSTILRAAWALLLSTYTRSQDVIFGTTLSGRNVPLAGIERVVGPTMTTVPIRIQTHRTEQTGEFLRRVQDQSTQMIDYEHTGLQTIRKISPEACDFQNLLVLQPRGKNSDHSKLWTSEKLGDTSRFLTYPLIVQCSFGDNDDVIFMTATSDESRIPQGQMQRIITQYQNIILQLSAHEGATLGQLDMFSPDDMSELREWIRNGPQPDVVDSCLHHQVLEQAYKYPNHTALSSSCDDDLTYKDLYEFSRNLTLWLVESGAGPRMTIPVIFDKSVWAVVAMLSVLMSGAAFVPIDPESPTNRRNHLFDRVNASIILTSPKYVELCNIDTALGVDRVFLESLPQPADRDQSLKHLMMQVSTSDPAYILFTSGSTGVPKGVVVSHRAVCSSINAHGKSMGFGRQTRALQFGSYTFDASIAEIFTTLVFGGTVCVPSPWGRMNDLANEIRSLRVNWSFLTPSVARLLEPSEVPTLEVLALGGEEVSSSEVSRWSKRKLRLINGYGPTEACIFCVTRDIDSPDSARTIGKPIGCNAYVVDPNDHNKLAPIGTVGELLVSGPILATGYLNDEARSSTAFIGPPSWAEALLGPSSPSRTFYKTGDIVRYNHSGEIEYMSRKDLQVKVRGLRIELEDVEHWIQADNQIKHALVLPSKTKQVGSQNQLVAIVSLLGLNQAKHGEPLSLIPAEASSQHIPRIKESIAQHLPLYAVPNHWVCVNEIPLSSSSKINRKAVSEWVANLSKDELTQAIFATTNGYHVNPKPAGRLEEMISDIWSSVLDIPAEELASNKSFLGYGGDSISAIRVIKECRKQLLSLTVEDLLLAKGISDLVRITESKQQSVNESGSSSNKSILQVVDAKVLEQCLANISGVEAADLENIIPCTPLQEGMLQNSAKGFYIVEMIFEIHSAIALDIPRLREAWHHVMKRHSTLRTIFTNSTERQGEHYQIILKRFESSLVEAETVEEQSTLRIRSSVSTHSAYRSSEPHHRLVVQRTREGKNFMKLEIPHSITDGVSLGIVFRDLGLAYDGRLSTQAAPQFLEYCEQLWRQTESDRTYWQQYCAQASPCYIPCVAKDSTSDLKLLHTAVEQPDPTAVLPFCQRNGISVANLFHMVWALVLKFHITACGEVIFGYLVSGRDMGIEDIENVVGPLISMLISRNRLRDSAILAELLAEVRDDAARSSSRKYCDMRQIERELGLEKRLFNTMINFRKYPKPSSAVKPSIEFEYLQGLDPFEYNLMLVVDELDNTWKVNLAYLSPAIEPGQATEIAADFTSMLNFVLTHPQESISAALWSFK